MQVNSIGFTVRDALKLVADFEGAHTNDELPAFVGVGVKPDDFDKGAKKALQDGKLRLFRMSVLYSTYGNLFRSVHCSDDSKVDSRTPSL